MQVEGGGELEWIMVHQVLGQGLECLVFKQQGLGKRPQQVFHLQVEPVDRKRIDAVSFEIDAGIDLIERYFQNPCQQLL